MSRALRLVIALAIATPLFVSMGGPAVACSCVDQTAKKVLEHADAVVAGHVVGEQPIDAMNTHSTLAVDGVYKGHVDATIVLNANIGFGGGSSCAVLYPVGSKADPLVLERLDDGTYQVSVCAFLSRAEVVRVLGSARPPSPGSAAPSVVAAACPSTTLPGGVSRPAVLGGLVVALLAIALILRWSGRRKPLRVPSAVEELQATVRGDRG